MSVLKLTFSLWVTTKSFVSGVIVRRCCELKIKNEGSCLRAPDTGETDSVGDTYLGTYVPDLVLQPMKLNPPPLLPVPRRLGPQIKRGQLIKGPDYFKHIMGSCLI